MNKRKKSGYNNLARQTIMGGMGTMVGSGVLGQVGSATGASPGIVSAGQAGMGLLATANTARAGMGLVGMMGGMMGGKKRKRR